MTGEEKTTDAHTMAQPEPSAPETPAGEMSEAVPMGQLVVSVAGGIVGVGMFIAGAVFAVVHGIFSLWPLILIGGSVVLYALLIAWDRKQEQASAAVRRTLHGYNVFLMSGLLLVVLGIVNVMVFTYGSEPMDMTSLGVHSLAPQTETLLDSLDEEVVVTVVYPEQSADPFGRDFEYVRTRRMLEESLTLYSQHSRQVEVRYLDPYEDRKDVEQLKEKYLDLSDVCVLVEYGSGESPDHEVLKHQDLVDVTGGMMGEAPRVENKSEDALTSSLIRLTEGNQSIKIYFTNGNGELDPEDSTQNSQRGIGLIKDRLEDTGIEIGTFQPGSTPKVPEDADLVIVAGPQQPFSEGAVQSMRDYLVRGGKMIILADITMNPLTKTAVDLGLAPLLDQVNVTLGDERIRFLQTDRIGRVYSSPSGPAYPTDADLQLVTSLAGRPVTFLEPRRVAPARETPPMPGAPSQEKYQVVSILEGGVPAADLEQKLDRDIIEDLLSRQSSLGVAVSENKGSAPPPMPGHPPIPNQQDSEPRLIVLGDAEFVANDSLMRRGGYGGFTLMMGCVNWLRGRLELLGLEPKERKPSGLDKNDEERWAMVWKPTAFFLFFFIATGISVWKVRHMA